MNKFPASYKITYSPDGSLFARMAGSVYVYSSGDFKQIYRFTLPKHPGDVVFSPDSSLLAIISTTGMLRVYSMKDGSQVFSYFLKEAETDPQLVFTDNDTLFVYSIWRAWTLPIGSIPVKLETKRYYDMFFRTDGRVFSFYRHGERSQAKIKEYTSGTPQTVIEIPAVKGAVSGVFLSDYHLCVLSSGSVDDYENRKTAETGILRQLNEFLRENEPQIAGSEKFFCNFSFFERSSGETVGMLTSQTQIEYDGFALSMDSGKIAIALDGKVFVLTASGAEEVLDFGEEVICQLDFTPDGGQLLVGTWQHGYVIPLAK